MRIMIINGPNLNLLGVREPHIYGSITLDAIRACEAFATFAGAFDRSNYADPLVDLIQSARPRADHQPPAIRPDRDAEASEQISSFADQYGCNQVRIDRE